MADACTPRSLSFFTASPPREALKHADLARDTYYCEKMIFTYHIVTDKDGSLTIKRIGNLTYSKAYLDFSEALGEAKANLTSASIELDDLECKPCLRSSFGG